MEREGVAGAAGLHRGHQHHGHLADQRHDLQLSLRQIRPRRADGKTSVWWVEWRNFVKYQIYPIKVQTLLNIDTYLSKTKYFWMFRIVCIFALCNLTTLSRAHLAGRQDCDCKFCSCPESFLAVNLSFLQITSLSGKGVTKYRE